jgi:hypothetical protein
MGEFGWAYISGSNQNVGGPVNSVQVRKDSVQLTGSQDLTFDPSTQTLALTGTLNVSGTVNANAFNLDVINKNVTNLDIYGSSKFGDTSDDLHQFTGSLNLIGNLSSSINISASSYYGDGSKLENIIAASVPDPLVVGIVSGSTAISGAVGRFGTIEGILNASNLEGTLNLPIVSGSTAVSGTVGRFGSVEGVLNTPAQPNITTIGTLSDLSVTGDLTVDTSTLKVFSSGNNVAIGRSDTADKKLEIYSSTGGQFRLSNLNDSFPANIVYTDFDVGSNGDLTITPHGNDIYLSGNVYITGSTIRLTDIPSGTATTSSYLALDANRNIILTSSAGGSGGSGGGIGDPEDNASPNGYADGLFTDFTPSTPVGTPIDRFNEVLKILAPSPSPTVSRITGSEPSGITAKLSFGSSKVVTGYTSSGGTAGFDVVDAVGIYSASITGSNFRLGVYNGTQDITGAINFHVTDSITNGYMAYSNNSFGNANEGTLKLELNGTTIHSVSLSGLDGAGNPNSGSGDSLTGNSGFINVSVTASSIDGNNSEWYIFKYRTAKYKIAAADQKVGWNYARVIHTLTSDNETNYVEWINDISGASGIANMSASSERIEDIVLTGGKYLSGVKYNTDATAKYKVDLLNLYKNVYAASGTPISFTAVNSSNPSAQSVADLGGGDDRNKVLGVTGSLDFNGSTLFNAAITCNTTVTHPLKTTITNTGSATTGNGFLIDNRTLASTNLQEKFHDESFRKTSGSYDTQDSVSVAAASWDSQTHMTGSNVDGHQDGLLFHNQRLYSPVDGDIPNGGDFKAMSNASGSSQPDYVNDTPLGTRTFYRVITNSSGVAKRDIKIVSTKNSTKYNNSTLSSTNTHLFAKIPGSTGWMDISQPFVYGSTLDGHGALITTATNNSNTGSADNSNATHFITFGTQSISNNQLVMIKMVADETWSGYVTEMSFSVGATTNTATESDALDNIDLDDSAGEGVMLSFGASNGVTDYTNATGSNIGLSNYNSNELYSDNGSTRRGVFKVAEVMGGTLNEDINASGNNYSANSFKDAYTGSLLLVVNDITCSTLNLSNLNANNNLSSDTGFSVGTVGFSTTTDGIPDYTKTYRTGTYSIGTSQQRVGYNVAKVIHKIGVSDTPTNYVEWVIDPSGSADDTSISSSALSNFGHSTTYYQSGIGYFASNPTASYTCLGSNFYRNVYQSGSAISFPTVVGCTVTNIRITGSGITTYNAGGSSANMPALNNTTDCETTTIELTGTIAYNSSSTSLSGGLGLFDPPAFVTARSQINHPFKSNRQGSSLTKSSFLRHSGTLGSTNENTQEYFGFENYRIVSGNYTTQSEATGSAKRWNSSTKMNNGGTHDDGMVTINNYLISPKQIGNDGDTRGAGDGGSLQAPYNNPDYSSLTNNTRTYYRYFKNNTVNDRSSITVTLYGTGSLVYKSTSLGDNNNFYLEVKLPSQTSWLDAGKELDDGDDIDGAGSQVGGGIVTNIVPGGSSFSVNYKGNSQLGSLNGSQAVVFKISAHENWTGYLSRISVAYS